MRCAARLVFAALWLLVEVCQAESGAPSLTDRVIWAVNCGGDAHTDVHGINFKKDPLEGKLGKGECIAVIHFLKLVNNMQLSVNSVNILLNLSIVC